MTAQPAGGCLALPMYNVTPGVAALWHNLLDEVRAQLQSRGWRQDMQVVHAPGDLMALWRSSDLVLSQTCGYPLVTQLQSSVRVLAVPAFDFPGCDGVVYRSAIVVPEHGARSLEELRGRVVAVNQQHSHSGMNALRHDIAPLARDGRFFSRVEISGGHMASMALVQSGRADVAAIDCVTLGLARRYAPATTAGLRVLQLSAPAPGLPLIGASTLTDTQVEDLRAVLAGLPDRLGSLMAQLGVRRFAPVELADYQPVRAMEQLARAHGYLELA